MRRINLEKMHIGEQEVNVAKVIYDVLQVTPVRFFSLGEIRARAKILDVLEANFDTPYLDMEDAEWEIFKRALNEAPLGAPGVKIDVLFYDKLLGRVLDAEPAPPPPKPTSDDNAYLKPTTKLGGP